MFGFFQETAGFSQILFSNLHFFIPKIDGFNRFKFLNSLKSTIFAEIDGNARIFLNFVI